MKKLSVVICLAALTVLLMLVSNARDRKDAPPASTLYGQAERIEIAGYNGDAMEPCISLDGKYLFFNNSNEIPGTHIYFAQRVSALKFEFSGEVSGLRRAVNPAASWTEREMAPSVDSHNRFFYTCPHSYATDRRTLYAGLFRDGAVASIESLSGDISPQTMPWLNMDCCISPDGNTLIISRAKMGKNIPSESDLLLARRQSNGEFKIDPESGLILRQINSRALEYAPAITADLLELYFTRTEIPLAFADAPLVAPVMQTMVARRKNVRLPFDPAQRLAAIEGFAEAPSLTLDKRELFYHRKDADGRFHIYRVLRLQS